MKQQFLVSHTIHQTEVYRIARHLGLLSQNAVSTENASPKFFHKNITRFIVGLLMIYQSFSGFCKTVFRWVIDKLVFTDYLSK